MVTDIRIFALVTTIDLYLIHAMIKKTEKTVMARALHRGLVVDVGMG